MFGRRIFEHALRIERSHTVAEVIQAGRAFLPRLGVTHFFFGTLHDGPVVRFDWADHGSFPLAWLRTYDNERYAMTDPLLAVVRQGLDAFFWDDAIDRRIFCRQARAMFDGVAAHGITDGFVAFYDLNAPLSGAGQDVQPALMRAVLSRSARLPAPPL